MYATFWINSTLSTVIHAGLSKICLYLCLPRKFTSTAEREGWHPRQAIAKTADAMFHYPDVDPVMKKKVERMKGKICKVSLCPKARGRDDLVTSKDGDADDPADDEGVWLEWDGRLNGVE